jgi:hypothetical protein
MGWEKEEHVPVLDEAAADRICDAIEKLEELVNAW